MTRMCASFAHALADRVMLISGHLDLLEKLPLDEGARRHVEQVRTQAERVLGLFERARRFAAALRPAQVETDIRATLETAVAGSDVEVHCPAHCSAIMPDGALAVVVESLVAFAESSGSAACLSVELTNVARGADTRRCLVSRLVLASGVTLPKATRTLLEPWLAETHEGDAHASLSLSLAAGTVRDLGGWCEVSDERGQPSLTLYWPVEASASER